MYRLCVGSLHVNGHDVSRCAVGRVQYTALRRCFELLPSYPSVSFTVHSPPSPCSVTHLGAAYNFFSLEPNIEGFVLSACHMYILLKPWITISYAASFLIVLLCPLRVGGWIEVNTMCLQMGEGFFSIPLRYRNPIRPRALFLRADSPHDMCGRTL